MSMQMSTTKLQHDCGFVIFNYDTPTMQYSVIAKKCIELLRIHCPNIPITVIGDHIESADINIPHECPTNTHNIKGAKVWFNLARADVYELSPFESTIVLDSDYLVFDSNLLKLFESGQSVLSHCDWFDCNNVESSAMPLGISYMEMLWATVLKFDKTEEVGEMFAHWKDIIKNYRYYSVLWKLNRNMIRNDHAFTIAMKKVQNFGSVQHCHIPWDIVTCNQNMTVKQLTNNSIVLEDQHGLCEIKNQSVHILNKESLIDVLQ